MERTDLIKDQIERVGKVLAKIIGDFLGTKANVDAAQRFEASHQQFKSELDLDINDILEAEIDDLKFFFEKRNFTESHLEELAKFFKEVGKSYLDSNNHETKRWLKKAIILLDINLDTSDSFSLGEVDSSTSSFIKMDNLTLRNEINELLKD